jgi:hypothetical protein
MDEFPIFALYLADGLYGDDIDILVDAEHYPGVTDQNCIIA